MNRSHGITRNKDLMSNKTEGSWYYQQIRLGFNYRMTDLQAALGISQMSRLDKFVKKRHLLRERYDKFLKDLPLIIPYQSLSNYSALHLYPIQIDLEKIKKTRSQVFDELRSAEIGVNVHYIPIHMQPYYNQFGFQEGDFPCSEYYYSRAISLPLFFSMTFDQQDKVIKNLRDILV